MVNALAVFALTGGVLAGYLLRDRLPRTQWLLLICVALLAVLVGKTGDVTAVAIIGLALFWAAVIGAVSTPDTA